MTYAVPLLCFSVVCAATFNVIAQERAAGGTLDAQMTWSSLSNQIKAVDAKATTAHDRIDKSVECGKLGKIYAPGASGAVNGCVEASSFGGITLSQMYAEINASKSTLQNIINCNKQAKLFDGATCMELPFEKQPEYVETAGWVGSFNLSCSTGRKITYAMGNASKNSNQLACGRSGANCDSNLTASLAGRTNWAWPGDGGRGVMSAYIECK